MILKNVLFTFCEWKNEINKKTINCGVYNKNKKGKIQKNSFHKNVEY